MKIAKKKIIYMSKGGKIQNMFPIPLFGEMDLFFSLSSFLPFSFFFLLFSPIIRLSGYHDAKYKLISSHSTNGTNNISC
jgi:hypothetical protein